MEDFNKMINGNKPVLVDFYAAWCEPCQMMHPILRELKSVMGDNAHILKLDIENRANSEIVQQFKFRSIPNLMIFRNGERVWQESGVKTVSELERLLRKFGE